MSNTQATQAPSATTSSSSKQTITIDILKNVKAADVVIRTPKVVRLGNERDEVFLGDVLTLAAVTSFQVPAGNGVSAAFCIDLLDNGDLGSLTNNALREPDVAKWLADTFSFTFSLKNESGRHDRDLPENVLRRTAMPWVRILDTSGLTADLLEIDVAIELKPSPGSLPLSVRTPDAASKAVLAALNDVQTGLAALTNSVNLLTVAADAVAVKVDAVDASKGVVVERIVDTHDEVRRLHESFQRFAAFQEKMETVDWNEMRAGILLLLERITDGKHRRGA